MKNDPTPTRTGYVHVYTGNGKGKTTAAIGLAVRALGAGLKVYLGQFAKCRECCELKTLAHFKDQITIEVFGTGFFIVDQPTAADIEAAKTGFTKARDAVNSGKYDLVILDEINIAMFYTMVSTDEVLDLIKNKPNHVELILTGRCAVQEVIDVADLVTEMREIKHYYSLGVLSRPGVE